MSDDFKKKYTALRKRYTQTSIAGRLGISQAYLSMILNGKKKPPKQLAQRIKKELN